MKKLIYILSLLLVVFVNIKAQDKDIFSYNNRLKFANYLFNDNDFIRALEEFNDLQTIKNSDTVQFKIALSFYNMNKINEAKDNLKALYFNSSLSDEAKIFTSVILFKENRYKLPENEFNISYLRNDKYKRLLVELEAFSTLYYSRKIDTSLVKKFSDKFKLPIKSFIERKNNFEFKSPTKSAILSAIIPGLGKVYAGNNTDGITSLIYIAALGYLSYTNFDHNHDFRGYLFGGLATYFYAGNIYGSYDAAFQYNEKIKFRFRKDLESFIKSINFFLPDWSFLK